MNNSEANGIGSFRYFRNYHEFVVGLGKQDAMEMLYAIDQYVFEDVLPDFENPLLTAIFNNIKVGLDASKRRAKNKNAVKKEESTEVVKPTQNQLETNSKPTQNQDATSRSQVGTMSMSLSMSMSNKSMSKSLEKEGVGEETFKRIVTEWNGIGLAEVRTLSKTRKQKIRLRVKELGEDKVVEAIRQIPLSRFLMGDNKQGWQASFDWLFVNDSNLVKVLEGNYQDNAIGRINQTGNAFARLAMKKALKGEEK